MRSKYSGEGITDTIFHQIKNLFNDTPRKMILQREDPDKIDLIYNINNNCEFVGRYRKNFGDPPEETIEISLGKIDDSLDMDNSEPNCELFLFILQYVELEEFIHAAGINDVEEDHSEKWRQTLFDIVSKNMELGISHTTKEGETKFYDYRE